MLPTFDREQENIIGDNVLYDAEKRTLQSFGTVTELENYMLETEVNV